MTNWTPSIDDRSGPRYRAISDAIASDIASGRLSPGSRLPTHRDLAWRLGVTVGTVTRAYVDAERRGLITGEVGRGTFVRDADRRSYRPELLDPDETDGIIDLSINQPVAANLRQLLSRTVADICNDDSADALLRYQPKRGLAAHRAAGAAWLSRFGVTVGAEQVQVTGGGQNAMALALLAVAKPGDLILTEQLSYPAFKALATGLGFRVHGVAMDMDGLLPEAFDAACRQAAPRVLFLMPTVHNPTCATLPVDRRQAIVEIARRYDVMIVEDDVYGCLLDDPPPPLHSFGPDVTIYFTSLSKSVAPGLRVGFMTAPPAVMPKLTDVSRTISGVAAELSREVARRWIEDGTADRTAAEQRIESAARQQLARHHLGDLVDGRTPTASHLWLKLPEPWRRDEFCAAVLRRGVRITSADAFMVGRAMTPHAVRVSLCAPPTRAELNRGLTILADVLAQAPTAPVEIV